MAWRHHQTAWVPTTSLSKANRPEHERQRTPKLAKTTPNTKLTKTSARTTPTNVRSPPHLEPHPSPSRQGMCAYTKRRSRNTEPIRRPLHHRAMAQQRRRLDTPTNQRTTITTRQLQTVGIWGEPSSMGVPGVGVLNPSQGGAAIYFSITSCIMYLVYHSWSLNLTLLIPSTESVRKKVLTIHHSTNLLF